MTIEIVEIDKPKCFGKFEALMEIHRDCEHCEHETDCWRETSKSAYCGIERRRHEAETVGCGALWWMYLIGMAVGGLMGYGLA